MRSMCLLFRATVFSLLLIAAASVGSAATVQDSDSRVIVIPDSNDNEALSQAFIPGDELHGDFGDTAPPTDDFYYFNCVAGRTYQFFATTINCSNLIPNGTLGMDIDYVITDGFSILAIGNVNGSCQNEVLDFVAPSTGIFFLDLYEGRGVQTNAASYRIQTNELIPSPTPGGSPTPSPTPPPNASSNWNLYE